IQPGWHAARPATYPQMLTFYFSKARRISGVRFLPQDGNAERGPRTVVLETSDDGRHWNLIGKIPDACGPSGMWTERALPQPITTQLVRVTILANCGHPDLLTLRGVKFLP